MKAIRVVFAGAAIILVLPFVAAAFLIALATAAVRALADEW